MLGDGELKLESINIQNLSRVGQILDEPPKRSEEKYFGDTRHIHKSVIAKVLMLDTVLDTGFRLN